MLLVGAFFGRAGGLILLGLVATVGLAGATAADNVDGDTVRETPLTAAAVQPRYELGAGELRLDLTEVDDLEALDGRAVRLEGGAARIEVVVPEGMDVEVSARVDGPGGINLFGATSDGIGTARTASYDGGDDVPRLTLFVELGFGEIDVRTEK
jgi:hypothetical protein